MERTPLYRLKQPLGKEGMTFSSPGPSKQEWTGETAELELYLGNDRSMRIVVPIVTLEACPEFFDKIESEEK